MKIKKIIKVVILFFLIINVLFLPITIGNSFKLSRSVFSYNDYQKMKIKVDSLLIEEDVYSDGTVSSSYYIVYSSDLGFSFIVSDNEEAVINGKQGKNRNELHLKNYMDLHNDSIWVWYLPEVDAEYAKEDQVRYPIKRKIFLLFLNNIFVIIGVASLFIQIKKWISNK